MHFAFTQDQRLFKQSAQALFKSACSSTHLRAGWASDTGRVPGLWARLGELGLLGLLVPEAFGGSALAPLDLALVIEEAGYAAVPEPLVDAAAVIAPLLAELAPDMAARWLPRLAEGRATLVSNLGDAPFVDGAASADAVVLWGSGALSLVPPSSLSLVAQPSVDGARRLHSLELVGPSEALAEGEGARAAVARAFDRGALGTAALAAGVARRLLDLSVDYVGARRQFGKPIGSFQAIKHLLAEAAVELELTRPLVWRAALALGAQGPDASVQVSMAKAAASDAAHLAARTALQVHGAIGYSFECDLHLYMKRAWTLEHSFGAASWHRERVAQALLDGGESLTSYWERA